MISYVFQILNISLIIVFIYLPKTSSIISVIFYTLIILLVKISTLIYSIIILMFMIILK